MNRQGPKILILFIAIGFIAQMVIPGYIFAYDTAAKAEQRSEDHGASDNYDPGYGLDNYNTATYEYYDLKSSYYEYDSGDYGGDQAGSDYYDWGDYADDFGWEDGGYENENYYDDLWDDSYLVGDTDSYVYDWVEDGMAGETTYDPAADVFSLPIDDKSQFIMDSTEGDTSPETDVRWGMGKPESAHELLKDFGLEYK
ncbi:MAG: type II secretion system protein [Candidatus Omnitrophica bacterium]|nr:type II secretion system protein [Candidatus Omnitrophota bacterium]